MQRERPRGASCCDRADACDLTLHVLRSVKLTHTRRVPSALKRTWSHVGGGPRTCLVLGWNPPRRGQQTPGISMTTSGPAANRGAEGPAATGGRRATPATVWTRAAKPQEEPGRAAPGGLLTAQGPAVPHTVSLGSGQRLPDASRTWEHGTGGAADGRCLPDESSTGQRATQARATRVALGASGQGAALLGALLHTGPPAGRQMEEGSVLRGNAHGPRPVFPLIYASPP